MITSVSSMLAIALQSQVYLVEFENKDIENKARISFHHSLVSDNQNGVLMRLSDYEVSKLTPFAKAITPANDEFEALTASYARAANKAKQQAGIPGYTCYTTVEETFTEVDSLVQAYPEQTDWVDIGDSWQKANLGAGYDIKVLKIGKISDPDAPILFMQSGMHAREYAPVGLTLAFAKTLLEQQTTNPDIAWILANQQIHILFHSNPDGRKIAETGVLQRKNHNENYCASNVVGVDLNRNFSFGWGEVAGGSSGEACSEVFRGPSAGSEPETQAVENYVRSIFPDLRGEGANDKAPDNRSGLYLDIHSYSELVLWPWGGTELPAPNELGLKSLGHKLAYFNNYAPMQSVGLYPTDGTSDNLAYNELGVAHITFEVGTKFFQDCATFNNKIKPDNLNALLYAARVASEPYNLSQGPDITNDNLVTSVNSDGSVQVEATASEKRYLTYQGKGLAEHTINEVRYSVNDLISESNYQTASFKDGSGNASIETVSFQIGASDFTNNSATVYLQAKDSSGRFGPIYAYNVNNKTSSTPQQPDTGETNSGSSSGGLFVVLFGLLALAGLRRR